MIISKTPLRVSFAGGGSDLKVYYQNGYGSVLSTAIDKFMYVSVNKTFDQRIRVIYSKVEFVERIEDIEHNLAREALKLIGITGGGIDITYMGDMLPAHAGSGLGASSSLAVGILNALHACNGERVSTETLAREACQIEIEVLGRPIGKQDQYAAAYGGLNFMRFDRDESVSVTPANCSRETLVKLNQNLLLFYTGLKTQSDNILTEQAEKTPENLPVLGRMVGLSEELNRAVTTNDLSEFSNKLHEGWLHKQKLAAMITNEAIDNFYGKAREAGATGGKLLGSGGGGFLLLYCEKENQVRVREALSELREAPFNFEPEGSKIIYNSDSSLGENNNE
ncbi:MAG: GHMP kinase [Dehalococcoidales bacterium]|nr:GHMP kinase [Dehalococcoidales bacterium]